MTKKLQGRPLAAATAEAIKAIEDREVAAQKAEVSRVVEQITRDIKGETRCLNEHRKAVEATNERIEKLQKRLKALKAGDQAALKNPEPKGGSVTGRSLCLDPSFISRHEDLHRQMQYLWRQPR